LAQIAVVGVGYVGLVTAASFAELGHTVVGIDTDAQKIAKLQDKLIPIFEPGLEDIVVRSMDADRLRFTTDYFDALDGADFAFIAVGTPTTTSGAADMTACESAVRSISRAVSGPLIIVNKSTMPVGSAERLQAIVREELGPNAAIAMVSNPEFLAEGTAIENFFVPDRVVLGSSDPVAADAVAALYRPLNAPVLLTDCRTAEMVKYASNAFLATKISFMNEIAGICDRLGADVKDVAKGMGFDKRIGERYLDAGLGYGGSCFPKDVRALEHSASIHGFHTQLLRAVIDINTDIRRDAVNSLRNVLGSLRGKQIGVLGLAFKPNTDDVREAPALEIIHLLQQEGACIRAYDPLAMRHAETLLPGTYFGNDAYDVAMGCDALVLATAWEEFRTVDLQRLVNLMRTPIILDGRNTYDPREMSKLGFVYLSIGRNSARRERPQRELVHDAPSQARTYVRWPSAEDARLLTKLSLAPVA
jgi:UDPglucose 6-dehydrogenase